MPRRSLPHLKRQRGSILAATVGLSVVLSAAAAGFILVSGQVRGGDVDAINRAKLYYSAESGLLMGTRRVLKTWRSVDMRSSFFASTTYVSGPTKDVDGVRDSVVMIKNVATGAFSIVCWATHSYPSDTVRLTWAVKSVDDPQEGDGLKSRLVMGELRDTVLLRR
jgi:hypothetical protein